VLQTDSRRSKRLRCDADLDNLIQGVDVDRRLRGARDGDVPGGAEHRLYVHPRASNPHPVEQFARRWHGDGGKYTQNAERNRELDDCERVSHVQPSFPTVIWLDSI